MICNYSDSFFSCLYQAGSRSLGLIAQHSLFSGSVITLIALSSLTATTYLRYNKRLEERKITEQAGSRTEKVEIIRQQQLSQNEDKNKTAPLFSKASIIAKAKHINGENENHTFPPSSNKISTAIEQVEELYCEEDILRAFEETRLLIHPSVSALIDGFLQYKLTFGSRAEKHLYSSISKADFIRRLAVIPPFFSREKVKSCLLTHESEFCDTDCVNDQQDNLLQLTDPLTPEEFELSTLIGISIPTHFINKGDSFNEGKIDTSDEFEKRGICIGFTGPQLDDERQMDAQWIVITDTQNRVENGYGPLPENEENDDSVTAKMRLFARFYKVNYFPLFSDISSESTNQREKSPPLSDVKSVINQEIYKKRMKINIENYLAEANRWAENNKQKAYVQPYGWGLQSHKKENILYILLIQSFLEVIQENAYPHIADIDFSLLLKIEHNIRIPDDLLEWDNKIVHDMRLHFPKHAKSREFCTKLTHDDTGKLLVNTYNWKKIPQEKKRVLGGQSTDFEDDHILSSSPLQFLAQSPDFNPYLSRCSFLK